MRFPTLGSTSLSSKPSSFCSSPMLRSSSSKSVSLEFGFMFWKGCFYKLPIPISSHGRKENKQTSDTTSFRMNEHNAHELWIVCSTWLLPAEHTGVLESGFERWNIFQTKLLYQIIGLDSLDKVSRVAEEIRRLGGCRLRSPDPGSTCSCCWLDLLNLELMLYCVDRKCVQSLCNNYKDHFPIYYNIIVFYNLYYEIHLK